MISNQPKAAPADRPPEERTALNAVFRRLSNGQRAAAEALAPPAAPRAEPAARPAAPVPPRPDPPIAPEPPPEPVRVDPRVSFAAAVLARAGATIAARAARESEAAAARPSPAATASTPAVDLAEPAEPPPQPTPPPPQGAAAVQLAPEPPPAAEAATALAEAPPPAPTPVAKPLEADATAPPEVPAADAKPLSLKPAAAPGALAVPAWLVAPVLRIAIPDSPFGRGNSGGPNGRPASPPPAAEPDTIGFAEAAPRPSAVPEPPPAAPAAIIAPDAAASPDCEPEAAPQPPAAEPADASDTVPPPDQKIEVTPATVAVEPTEAADLLAEQPRPEATGTSALTVEDHEPEPPAAVPPPRAARPLGAPQAAARPVVADEPAAGAGQVGLPAAELPAVIVEPAAEPSETADTAVGPRRDDRPTMRNRRLYRRVALDADFEIDGTAAKLLDLSMGGFAAANAPVLAPNAVVPVTVRLGMDGVDISTRMRALLVYAETPRSGGRFIDLTPGQTAFLRYVVTWRGESAGALGTATLLEAISRPPERFRPPESPALEPPGRAERRSWWSRWFGWLRARGAPN